MFYDELPKLEPIAFCYWLQGAIEIGKLDAFTPELAQKVRYVLEQINRHNIFTLQSLILLNSLPPAIAFVHIHRELQQMFRHVIDNSYGGDQEFFHLVHQGEERGALIMLNYEFACWVRGYLQLCPDDRLDSDKLYILKNHLNLVAAVEGSLGEKNQQVFDRITEILATIKNTENFQSFKQFLQDTYFVARNSNV